jgi:hypothetical protein
MYPRLIEVILKPGKLLLQVCRIPKEKLVQILAAYRPDESFNKWIRNGHVWHSSHRLKAKDPQVGLPAMEPE